MRSDFRQMRVCGADASSFSRLSFQRLFYGAPVLIEALLLHDGSGPSESGAEGGRRQRRRGPTNQPR